MCSALPCPALLCYVVINHKQTYLLRVFYYLQAEPKNVVLVHGEGGKMEFLKQKIEQEFGKKHRVLHE